MREEPSFAKFMRSISCPAETEREVGKMGSYIERMETSFSDGQKERLKRIWEPTVTGVPLSNALRDVCILKDGEIRSYGFMHKTRDNQGVMAYLSSYDGGVSWNPHYAKGKMHSCTYIEDFDLYISSVAKEIGLYVYLSKIGPDDENPEIIKISDKPHGNTFQPVKSVYSHRIWFTAQRGAEGSEHNPAIFYFSDDCGKTWEEREMPKTPQHRVEYPHKGLRWSRACGTEPCAVELSENTLMMLIRNSTDCFYKCFSYDNGDTWTEPSPSHFYGTLTTPFLLRLRDGRIVAFWNNSRPLPEPDHTKTYPPVSQGVIDGYNEDVFTNRDVAHAAISDDCGKTWKGFREILLNPVRNNADFRYIGGLNGSNDKSVHQFQAYELPYGKILVSLGQNSVSRRILIFDVNRLYETESYEDFFGGLEKLSYHTYLKSISGSTAYLGNGHCAWNRTNSAYLVPDPAGTMKEVLSVSSHHDERIINDIGGVSWNFPGTMQGTVEIELKIYGKGMKFSLADRWYNPCDPYAAEQSQFSFEIDETDFSEGFEKLTIDYDTELGKATVKYNGKSFEKDMQMPCYTGISYLIVQCIANGDSEGCLVRSFGKK